MRQFSDRMRWSEAQTNNRWIDVQEVWAYRELIGAYVLRDLQLRYRQTVVGVAWVLLQPLAQTLVFSVFFQLLGRSPTAEDVPYPVMFLSGSILWQTFAQGFQSATMCLVNNRGIITKTYFPRLILPFAAVITPLIDFLIGWCCLVGLSLVYDVPPGVWWLVTPLLSLFAAASALAVGLWTSMLNARYRDVAHVLPFLIQLGFLLTPVIFQISALIPPAWQGIAALNPLATAIELFRAAWLQQPLPSLAMVMISVGSLATVALSGLWYFHRNENVIADRV
jgi:lipopolysaccharide transport system permease protein